MGFRIKPKGSAEGVNKARFRIVGEIRKSQSITTYGPGALIDFPRMSGIIGGIDNWESSLGKYEFNKLKIHDRNLEKILDKDFFIQPQTKDDRGYPKGITIERFPEYCYCPECGSLDKYYRLAKKNNNNTDYNSDIFCVFCFQNKNRNVKLIPSRFVISCAKGHINDFPYERFVHRNGNMCSAPKLKMEISKEVSGLEGIYIKCQCGARENLEGIMDKGAMYQTRCFGDMPWLGKKEGYRGWVTNLKDGEVCGEEVRVLQRGANNVYYPDTISALTIPPYSSRIQKLLMSDIDKLSGYYNMQDEDLKKRNLQYYFDNNKVLLRCDWEQFRYELNYALGEDGSAVNGIRDLMTGEYDALCDDDCGDPDFLTIETDVAETFQNYFSQVKIVGRLREVQVLKGFKRIEQSGSDAAPLSRKELRWLPGNELYGEGIFICFNEEKVRTWEQQNEDYYHKLVKRAKDNFFVSDKVNDNNTRYILLHSFAHLLIRELTLRCGYTSASIKEKIYSSQDKEKSMCGILIYTASSDSDGSLGGLARQGITEKLEDTILSLLESAVWCSNDPVCIDSKGQGYGSMNYGACHACALLPETSCECGNLLLDRGALIGSGGDVASGYFSDLFENE